MVWWMQSGNKGVQHVGTCHDHGSANLSLLHSWSITHLTFTLYSLMMTPSAIHEKKNDSTCVCIITFAWYDIAKGLGSTVTLANELQIGLVKCDPASVSFVIVAHCDQKLRRDWSPQSGAFLNLLGSLIWKHLFVHILTVEPLQLTLVKLKILYPQRIITSNVRHLNSQQHQPVPGTVSLGTARSAAVLSF